MVTSRGIAGAWLVALTAGCTTSIDQRVDALFADYAGNMPGAAVRVIQDGKVALTRTYGLARLDTGQPVTPATNFRLASITKHFTALATLMLVEQRLLALDTSITEVFDAFPAYGRGITIEHLLRHQSGLPDYEPLVPQGTTEQLHDADVLRLMIGQREGLFAPGSAYSYSNSGYALLAMMIEKTAGTTFADFLSQRIFGPSGMTNTIAFVDGSNTVPHRAFGYTVADGVVQERDQSPYSAVLGDGGVYSSLEDLTTWDAMGHGRELVSAATMDRILTPALETYGFGWRIDDYRGHRRIHHSGSTSGFRNALVRFPDDALTIIVLTNRAGPDVLPLAGRIAELYLRQRP